MASRRTRSLSRAFGTVRRDLDAATSSLRGTAPAPFTTRDGSGWPQPPRYWLQAASRPLHHVLISIDQGLATHAAMAAAALQTPADRATVLHAGTDPAGLLDGLSGPRVTRCSMGNAAPDASALAGMVRDLGIIDGVATRWYLCGPASQINPLADWLPTVQVDAGRILVERVDRAPAVAAPKQAWPVQLRIRGRGRELVVQPDQTILDAAREVGLDLPFSCTMGGCGACRQKVLSGKVGLPNRTCLTPEEKASGWTLLCVGKPAGPVVVEVE